MASIAVSVRNDTSDSQNAHVFDQFASGAREVNGSPFALARNETSPSFGVFANDDGTGMIKYRCENGPSNSGILVHDGSIAPIE